MPDSASIHSEAALWTGLAALAPRIVTWLLSLMTLGIFWVATANAPEPLRACGPRSGWLSSAFSPPSRFFRSRRAARRISSCAYADARYRITSDHGVGSLLLLVRDRVLDAAGNAPRPARSARHPWYARSSAAHSGRCIGVAKRLDMRDHFRIGVVAQIEPFLLLDEERINLV